MSQTGLKTSPRHTGFFLSLEGGEGTGKSTQAKLLAQKLGAHGFEVLVTREPGGSPLGAVLRELLLSENKQNGPHIDGIAEALLFYADRHMHVTDVITPALRDGKIVITDRFFDSTFAYQGARAGVDPGFLQQLHDLVLGAFKPDLTFILDVPIDVGRKRLASRGQTIDRIEAESSEFHMKLQQIFKAIALENPARCQLVEAHRPVEDLAEELFNRLCACLQKKGLMS